MSNWDIKTDTRKDALHFSKIGAYAGFVWCFFIVFGAIFTAFFYQENIYELGEYGTYWYFGEKAFVFIIAWILSWRVFSGKGYISAIILLVFFISYRILLIFADPSNIYRGIILSAFIAYGMYAGIRGTQAMRRFNNNTKIDVDVFD